MLAAATSLLWHEVARSGSSAHDFSEQIAALGRDCPAHAACNVVGVHVFSFGRVTAAAGWMNRAIAPRTGG